MVWTGIFGMLALWPSPRRYDLGLRSLHILGSWTTIVWNIQIKHGSKKLWSGHGFWVCVRYDLHFGDMTLDQGHGTSLGHGQQLCEILSRSNIAVRAMARTGIFGMWALWPWICRYHLGLRSWHILGSSSTIVWNIIQTQHGSEE